MNSSDLAYGWGHAGLAATAVAVPGAITAARYLFFHDMPVTGKGWCPYCIVDALAHIAVFGFTIWESKKAIDRLRGR